jgi:hypothetical protein
MKICLREEDTEVITSSFFFFFLDIPISYQGKITSLFFIFILFICAYTGSFLPSPLSSPLLAGRSESHQRLESQLPKPRASGAVSVCSVPEVWTYMKPPSFYLWPKRRD